MAAFTLVELLVVIAIIGLLATIGLPALKGFGKGTGMAGAQRQLLQDLGLARLSAINGRTTVYIVFVPTNILDRLLMPATPANTLRQLTNLLSGQYTAYALLTKRSAGDQPGQGSPRYISEWRRLPPGILFPPVKFDQAALNNDPSLAFYPVVYKTAFLTNALPFPTGKSPLWPLPYVAFNSKGQLVSGRDEMIPLAEGSIFFARNNQGMVLAPPDVVIKPPNNYTNRFRRPAASSTIAMAACSPKTFRDTRCRCCRDQKRISARHSRALRRWRTSTARKLNAYCSARDGHPISRRSCSLTRRSRWCPLWKSAASPFRACSSRPSRSASTRTPRSSRT